MREYKDVTSRRGGHFSLFDNINSKVRLCCWLILKKTRKRERESWEHQREGERKQLWSSELKSEWREGALVARKPVNQINKMWLCSRAQKHAYTPPHTHLRSTLWLYAAPPDLVWIQLFSGISQDSLYCLQVVHPVAPLMIMITLYQILKSYCSLLRP